MPVNLTTRPEPGGLITADTMLALIAAVETLQTQMADVQRRLVILEQGGFRKPPKLIPILPDKYKDFVTKVRGGDIKILEEPDKLKRLETIADLYKDDRGEFTLDDEIARTELTAEEWIIAGTAAGVKPSQVATILETKYPTTAAAINAKLGDQTVELDSYADIGTGRIGFLQ